jgi:hypothetical protein
MPMKRESWQAARTLDIRAYPYAKLVVSTRLRWLREDLNHFALPGRNPLRSCTKPRGRSRPRGARRWRVIWARSVYVTGGYPTGILSVIKRGATTQRGLGYDDNSGKT